MKKSPVQHKAKAKKTVASSAKNSGKIKLGTTVSRKLLVLLLVVVALALIVLAWWGVRAWNGSQVTARVDRIESIYSSLNLDKDVYKLDSSNIFGDKRTYESDDSRTQSSVVTYVRGETVDKTAEDLDATIKAAGYEYFEEPYPGSVYKQYHYKSDKGEYVRLTVSSKPYDDMWRNANIMGKSIPDQLDGFDTNQGPSNVTIKVNLDDNNE